MRKTVLVLVLTVLAALAGASPASAAKPSGGALAGTLTLEPTTLATSIGPVTVSGSVTGRLTQFSTDGSGNIIASGTASGTLTATSATYGTLTLNVTQATVDVVVAGVDANCQTGTATVSSVTGSISVSGTLTYTYNGITISVPFSATIPISVGSFSVTATTPRQRAVVCDLARLLANASSDQALLDKLRQLLRRV
jgi:hypothetical protein